jgi:hypothetical protein
VSPSGAKVIYTAAVSNEENSSVGNSSLPCTSETSRLAGYRQASLAGACAFTHRAIQGSGTSSLGEEGYINPTHILGELPCYGFQTVATQTGALVPQGASTSKGGTKGEGKNAAHLDASTASTGDISQGGESNQGNVAITITWLVYDSPSTISGENSSATTTRVATWV